MAHRACAGRVTRVHQDHRHTRAFGLVLPKPPPLGERPAMQNSTLLPPNLYPFADPLQLLDGDGAPGAFSGSHDLLGNVVIDPRGKASLLARQLLQPAFSRAGLFPWQLGAQPAMTVPHARDGGARVAQPIGIGSDISYAQVHPKDIGGFRRRGFGHIACSRELEHAAPIDQIRFAALMLEQFQLRCPRREPHALAPLRGPDRDYAVMPCQEVCVVGDRPRGPEGALRLLVQTGKRRLLWQSLGPRPAN